MLFVLFELGVDRYAISSADVVEVLPLLAVKQLPGAPLGVAGLVDYRGTPTPLIDLSMLVLNRPAARRAGTRVLVVRYPVAGALRLLGLVAERATELLRRPPEAFQPSPVDAGELRFLGPVTRDARGLIQRVEVADLLPDAVREVLFPLTEAAAS